MRRASAGCGRKTARRSPRDSALGEGKLPGFGGEGELGREAPARREELHGAEVGDGRVGRDRKYHTRPPNAQEQLL